MGRVRKVPPMLAKREDKAQKTLHDPRWALVRARDPDADGRFVYSVATTGVYCRPTCAARPARPENVDFYATCAEAERAGYRACLRCRPSEPPAAERRAAEVAKLCRFIDESEETPSLETLARHAGLSVFYTQRVFKAVTGLTPKAYAAAKKAARARGALEGQASITAAVYDAGYGSSARFYETASRRLGMSPKAYRAGGKEARISFAIGACSLGAILVAATTKGVCSILLGDDPEALVHDLERRFPAAELVGGDADFEKTVALVVGLVEHPRRGARLPLDIRGTAFQERVWRALTAIPAGSTMTYAEVAKAIGEPKAVRAVAQACASNPIAIAVPCHRVVRSDGALAGYRWGIERKRSLLARETAS